ncbi:cAMP-responsive element-binding protein-like 2 isoform X2 [Drosophila serrata]|uniref:cAMP-responsive element-binding protein-like 2 isoform X2 n=1 Tax=Drosophila serrata TaxID=7274 RepID=UPI000A1CF55A|nr:cAMP-responsive element-binding protein-like 2 isoform X2 [Drosophila serrata]
MAEMECQSIKMSISEESQTVTRKECGKRGRKPGRKTSTEKLDIKAKLERSRQSARECRARKKLRYQYLEELVADREKAVVALRAELERVVNTME